MIYGRTKSVRSAPGGISRTALSCTEKKTYFRGRPRKSSVLSLVCDRKDIFRVKVSSGVCFRFLSPSLCSSVVCVCVQWDNCISITTRNRYLYNCFGLRFIIIYGRLLNMSGVRNVRRVCTFQKNLIYGSVFFFFSNIYARYC